MSYKVSIIVPVYNTADYLEECINSLLNQNYLDTEILIVDDGSTDNSWEILKQITFGHNHIKLFRKENGGQGSARNLALDHAEGEYVLFVDSDDWISKDMCKILLQNLCSNEVDILCFNYNLVYQGEIIQKHRITENDIWIGTEGLDAFFRGKITGHACNKLYRRDIIKSNRIIFNNEKRLYEDLLFSIQVLTYAKVVQRIPDAPYYYRIRSHSSTQSFDIRMLDQLVMLDKAIDFMKSIGNYRIFHDQIRRMISVSYVDIMIRSFNADTKTLEINKSLIRWREQVKIKYLSLKYVIIFLCSNVSISLAKWVSEKLISGLYSKIVVNRQ